MHHWGIGWFEGLLLTGGDSSIQKLLMDLGNNLTLLSLLSWRSKAFQRLLGNDVDGG